MYCTGLWHPSIWQFFWCLQHFWCISPKCPCHGEHKRMLAAESLFEVDLNNICRGSPSMIWMCGQQHAPQKNITISTLKSALLFKDFCFNILRRCLHKSWGLGTLMALAWPKDDFTTHELPQSDFLPWILSDYDGKFWSSDKPLGWPIMVSLVNPQSPISYIVTLHWYFW